MSRRALTSIGIALLALALLAPAAGAAQERVVAVTASATLKVPNDSASLGFSVSRERRTRGAALQAVSGGLRSVIAATQAIPGVGPGDVQTGRISVRKTFRGSRPVYRAAEGIGVTLHQPEEAGNLVSAAIAAGASGVSGPNFFVGDEELAFAHALAAAFDKAKAKATALAVQAGGVLGPAIAIEEGSGGEFVPQSQEKAASAPGCVGAGPTTPTSPTTTASKRAARCTGAPPPVKPGTSTVTATVHVVFALQ
jgi:uncharacterized protein YggE